MYEIALVLLPVVFPISGGAAIILAWSKRRSAFLWGLGGVAVPIVIPLVLLLLSSNPEMNEEKWSKSFVWASFVVTALSMLFMLGIAGAAGTTPQPDASGPVYETTVKKYRYGPVISTRTRMISSGNPISTEGMAFIQLLLFVAWARVLTLWNDPDVDGYRLVYGLFLLAVWMPCYYVHVFWGFPWAALILFAVILLGSFYAAIRGVIALIEQ